MDKSGDSRPLFNVQPPVASGDHLEEWLHILAAENDKALRAVSRNKRDQLSLFKCGYPVRMILMVCKKFGQPPEVRYQAIELYGHFMVCHVSQLKRECAVRGGDYGDQKTMWKSVVARLGRQVLLRVLSCIQIVGKLHDPSRAITVNTMENILKAVGRTFTRKSIVKSELRVLREIAYKPAVASPLDYVEALLEVLGHNEPAVNVPALYIICLKVLDVFYVHRTEAYEGLFKRVSTAMPSSRQSTSTSVSQRLMPFTHDLIFLASTVVSCAAYCLDPVGYFRVTKCLHSITSIPCNEILEFTVVIIGLWNRPRRSNSTAYISLALLTREIGVQTGNAFSDDSPQHSVGQR